jgi:hypothetical protein
VRVPAITQLRCGLRSVPPMAQPEKDAPIVDALAIGNFMLEHNAAEKRIGELRDEAIKRAETYSRIASLLAREPERLIFEGQFVDSQFEGEPRVDRNLTDVDTLVQELRAAIMQKKRLRDQLAEMGVDPEESERQELLRRSRALRFGTTSLAAQEKSIGFTTPSKSRKK